ncbi:MFS transporter [Neobacillus sp. M.A.Huq-85]|nr:MFS transporter [Neobacillus cucumis]
MKGKFRWVIVSIIALTILINYLDRSALGFANGAITKQFNINNAEWGLIGSAFSIGYLILSFVGSPIIDKIGVKKALSLSAGLWSVFSILTAFMGSFVSLFLVRVLLGGSEGPAFPAVSRAISRWLPGKERGKALGMIVGFGVPFSLMIGGPIITQLMESLGWKSPFVILGTLGLILVGIWLWLFKDSPIGYHRVSPQEQEYIKSGLVEEETTEHVKKVEWKKIFTNKNLLISAFGYFSWGFMFWGFMYWLPGILSQVYHLNIVKVGFFTVLPWAVGTVATIAGGLIADKLYKRKPGIRSRFNLIGVCLLLSGASLIPIMFNPSLYGAITFISLGVGFGMVTGSIWWIVAIDSAPDQPAAASGFLNAAFALAGIIAPTAMGFAIQITGSFSAGFGVMIVLALLSSIGFLFFTKEKQGSISEEQRIKTIVH